MSDFNQLEMRRDSVFKEAVLSLAEARSMEIIAEAGKKRAEELEQAYKMAESADYAQVKEQYYKESEKEFMAVASQARQDLLSYRQELAEGLFAEAAKKLAEFTKSEEYPAWLAGRLRAHASLAEGGRPLTVRLRGADLALKDRLASEWPGLSFAEDATIRLGGLKVDDGKVLFDETIDEKLREEQKRFYESGRMRVQADKG